MVTNEGRSQDEDMIAEWLDLMATLLRGPGDAGAGQGSAVFGPLQWLLVLGLIVLLVLVAGLVIWRMRRTSSK
jgi:hypothetical protein